MDNGARSNPGVLDIFRFVFLLALVASWLIVSWMYSNGYGEEDENLFTSTPSSGEEIEKVKESYMKQELSIQLGNTFDHLNSVKANNSHQLPSRQFAGRTAEQMCESNTEAECVQAFARIRPLIVTAPNYRLMSCINQKSMSTVMSGIFCYLYKEKEFISGGRNILRELSDIVLCQGENTYKTVDGMLQILNIANASDWKFTMVTRDPVDRFLSGYIDRCLRRCNMQDYYKNYEFIRYSSDPSETLLTDLSRVLRMQNVSEASINYIAESLKAGRTIHSTVTSSSRAFLEERLRNSPYLMELIVRLFYYDYKLLGYRLPDLDTIDSQTTSIPIFRTS
ncbi:hypothetical protein NECAME_06963 [Necator americanus]|uniref:Uncharacterized protein n=1 Tax=Necator americanus TaxID=51031 RepID=W2TRC4_NECAM|nr:hypothetical protein NECAME_06963 [Necator americanus]ETN84219.1 hypothetical protein NECAME_06963 [Necator americanus]